MKAVELRKYCDSRIGGLRDARQSWMQHWRELANFILPRRYKWLQTPNEFNRGSPINGMIIDSTGTIALRVLASGMMSGVTSPTRPWFKLRMDEAGVEESDPINLWLADCERRMMRVFAESNFYTAMATVYFDLGCFGSASNLIYEDFDDVIRCFTPCLGEFYFDNDAGGRVNTVGREFTQTAGQLVERYGVTNVSDNVKLAYEGTGAGKSQQYLVAHLVEPNDDGKGPIPKKFRWRETFWEVGSRTEDVLACQGFHEWPGMCPRWDLSSNDAYGRSPGMDALGDIKQLQQETKRKAQAIDKMVNPPLLADITLKNQPASTIPGGVTYVAGLAQSGGMKPIYTVAPPVQELMQDIAEIQNRIKEVFFNPLFTMISNLETVRTATEIDARREEKLIQLGPVLERFQNEALDPAIKRTFGIMRRAGLLPKPPAGVNPDTMQIQYVSMLAEAQKAVSTGAIERLFSIAGNLAAVDPTVMDKINTDEGIDIYATLLAADPRIVRTDDEVAKIRADRAKQQQQAALAQQTLPAVQGAKVLSQTTMGNGQSALDQMLGNQGAPQ
jgi:hypothetical protein